MADPADKVTVKTVENTNTPQDVRKIDVSWGWRRGLIFGVVFGVSAMLAWVIWQRLDRLSDPAIVIFVRYSFYTMWLGLALYGSQATVSELAQAAGIFFSGRRTVFTSAPGEATVEAVPTDAGATGVKVGATAAAPPSPSYSPGMLPPGERLAPSR